MLTPGPDHPITLEPAAQRWRVLVNGHVLADTDDALILREANLPPVVYFPRGDVSLEFMGRTSHQTHCPYKGDAAYYTLAMDGDVLDNVAWSYEAPFEAMSAIQGRIAFYPDRVEVYAVDDAAVNPHHRERTEERMDRGEVDQIVQHTDSGSGASQRDHWAPNVEVPRNEDGGLR
jgi:uncharacterized protein (DUF427 family)